MEQLETNNRQLPGDSRHKHSLVPASGSDLQKTTEDSFENNDPDTNSNENGDEITNNDGSVVETLDTAFHNKPGNIKDHSIAGSNRQEYYEARSQGKSDAEEEQDFLRNQRSE